MKLIRKIRWTKATAILVVSAVLVVGLGAALAIAAMVTPAPLLATAAPAGNSVSLTWSSAGGAGTTYVIQYKLASAGDGAYTTATISPVASLAATVTDPAGLLNGSSYLFRVKGVNGIDPDTAWAISNPVTPSDQMAPTVSLQTVPAAPNGAGWFSVVPTYTIIGSDPSGISLYQVSVDTSASVHTITNGGPTNLWLTTGPQVLSYRATDGAGNTSAWATQTINVDVTTPTVSASSFVGTTGSGSWFNSSPAPVATITASAVASSPIVTVSYQWDSGSWTNVATSQPVPVSALTGTHVLTWKAANAAGGVSSTGSVSVSYDGVAPSVPGTPTLTLASAGGINAAWSASSDAVSGVTTYTVSYDTTSSFTATVSVTTTNTSKLIASLNDGVTYYFKVMAQDAAGNQSAYSGVASAKADTSTPTLNVTPTGVAAWGPASQPVTITTSDAGSGLASIKYRFYPVGTTEASATWSAPSSVATIVVTAPAGSYTLSVEAADNAGNVTDFHGDFYTDSSKPVSTFVSSALTAGINGWSTGGTASITATDFPAPVSGVNISSGVTTITVNSVAYSYPHTLTLAEGTNNFTYFATDAAGNAETQNATVTVKFDSAVPTITATGVNGYASNAPTSALPSVKLTAGDLTSGVDHIEYVFMAYGSAPVTATVWTQVASSAATATAAEGHFDLYYRAVDVAGNKSANAFFSTLSDVTIPTTTYTTVPTAADGANGSWTHAPAITFVVTDTVTAGAVTYSRWDSTGTFAAGTTAQTPHVAGSHLLEYYSIDAVGNKEATKTATFVVNESQPVATPSLTPSATTGSNGWYSSVPTASVTATTNGGLPIANIFYKYESASTWTTYTAAFAAAEGTHTLSFYATDASGTVGPTSSVSYKLDLTNPVVGQFTPQVVNSATATLTIPVTDAGSGLASGSFLDAFGNTTVGTVSGNTLSAKLAMPLAVGDNLIQVTVTDASGRTSGPVYRVVTYVINYTINSSTGANGVISPVGSNSVAFGANAAYTITPNAGYHIADVLVGGVSNAGAIASGSYTFTNVTAANTISATFAINTFTLTYGHDANGTISGTTPQTVNYGGSGTQVTAMANSGYHFVNWSDGSTTNPRTDTGVQANLGVTANFAANVVTPTYTLAYGHDANGTISGTANQTVSQGQNGTLVTAVANDGFHFTQWSDGVQTASRADANVQANLGVTAQFEADAAPAPTTYTVVVSGGLGGTVSWAGANTVSAGSNLSLTFTPNAGYHVAGIVVDGGAPVATLSGFTNITANHTVVVTFARSMLPLALTIKADRTISSSGHAVAFSGTISPNVPNGTKLSFQIRSLGSTMWTTVSVRSTFSSNHWSYSLSTKTRKHGAYFFRVRYAGTSYLGSVSPSVKLSIR